MKKSNAKNGFTLAEILITLAIIGVVAALTMPALITNIQDKELESKHAKAMNVLANGFKLYMTKEDMTKMTEMPIMDDCWENSQNSDKCISDGYKKLFNIVDDNLSHDDPFEFVGIYLPMTYYNPDKSESEFSWMPSGDYYFDYIWMTTDGFVYGIDDETMQYNNGNLVSFNVFTDVNANSKPNIFTKDMMVYNVDNTGKVTDVTSSFVTTAPVCTLDDPSGCTQAQCEALSQTGINGDSQMCQNAMAAMNCVSAKSTYYNVNTKRCQVYDSDCGYCIY